MSDHHHPWLDVQWHFSFTWTVLGAIPARTERVALVTGVTCPMVRCHPEIIAQAAATLALVSDGRFVPGVGSGERLNEHVVGRGFPDHVRERHELLREALEIIRLLWRGGYRSHHGKHLRLSDARVFDLPEELPLIAVAASGPLSARIAAELGDGLFATEDKASIVQHYRGAGGSGPGYAEVPMAWAPDERSAWAGSSGPRAQAGSRGRCGRSRLTAPTTPRTTPRSIKSCELSRSSSAVARTWPGPAGRLRIAVASSGAMTEK